ncbi:aminomethyl-transferring glycine dehydrogenase subunit GcvPB [Magnetofaba australis]|uniref:Probable glycine dehydrogenase (decarboxylating) subunit 2 n=1 Tax=Magnetofaba australis IT-1 TaxID=1434232 RepID=A0A1Y2K6G8_9PROT|nr:aminomethyl-transferring glycine dehydrogenase subunit GcvPB [Magnetofaba australis]OSM04948.1 putative glycine dehydrogenase subunit 2 [Magnetofaba australis IT-1]
MSVIFEQSQAGRLASLHQNAPAESGEATLPESLLRQSPSGLPEVSELQAVRHYTRLSQKNYGIDTHFYPLGSCTMKYNPRGAHRMAMLPGFLDAHPLADDSLNQGVLACLYELQGMIGDLTGMAGVSLAPMAGAQGEFAGVAMMRAYHTARRDDARVEILTPDAAHGTNPATASMCGYVVREIPTTDQGDVDVEALKQMVGPQTAGLMLTNPSTLGVFERSISEISAIVHAAGGLLYYDGANLNAIAGRVRPGDMGFDCVHVNVHKTFATPHGGGGPGAGPVGVSERLLPHLPMPVVVREGDEYRLQHCDERPGSIGRMSTFHGNIGVLLRAYAYLRLVGREGIARVADYATLNANYLMARLRDAGFQLAFPERRATHEFIISLKPLTDATGVRALDVAKRLLDYGFYAPTIYFPMLVPECMLIEPTESESREELDRFVDALTAILQEARENPELVKTAPHKTPVSRLDETRAARKPDLAFSRG